MKKVLRYLVPAGLVIALVLAVYYIRLPEYSIYKVFSYAGSDFRETDLHVIVYKPWQIDRKVQNIISRHNEMNGIPDKLTVWLYYSKYNLDKGNDFYKEIFEYGKSEVTDPPEAWQEIEIYQTDE